MLDLLERENSVPARPDQNNQSYSYFLLKALTYRRLAELELCCMPVLAIERLQELALDNLKRALQILEQTPGKGDPAVVNEHELLGNLYDFWHQAYVACKLERNGEVLRKTNLRAFTREKGEIIENNRGQQISKKGHLFLAILNELWHKGGTD